jgi:tetratricopeptide (TPR) repeat protein
VFPHALLFSGMREELILVGGSQPIALGEIERRFGEQRRVLRHLEQFGMRGPDALLARIVAGDASLRRRFGGGGAIRDTHNDLAHFFLDPGRPGAVAFDPEDVLAELRASGVASADELRGVLRHAGRLQYHAPGFPISSLRVLSDAGGHGVVGLDVDWEQIRRLEGEADRLIARGRRVEARPVLLHALELYPEQPKILRKLALVQLALGTLDAAVDTLHRFTALEPDDAAALHQLAALHEARGERVQAADYYRRAVERDPRLPMASLRLAWILATAPESGVRDGAEALRWAEHARERYGDERPEVLATVAAAHAERGQFDDAVRWQRLALARAPAARQADYRAGLARYEQRRPQRSERAYPWVH